MNITNGSYVRIVDVVVLYNRSIDVKNRILRTSICNYVLTNVRTYEHTLMSTTFHLLRRVVLVP